MNIYVSAPTGVQNFLVFIKFNYNFAEQPFNILLCFSYAKGTFYVDALFFF